MTAATPTRPSDAIYARAATRAHESGIAIVGRGYRKADHAPVYAISSATQPNVWHLVAVEQDQLVCNCKAGQHGRYCQHRALVHETLEAEREARRRIHQQRANWNALVMDGDVMERDHLAAADAREAMRATAPLARDNAAFSIFKQPDPTPAATARPLSDWAQAMVAGMTNQPAQRRIREAF